MISKFQFENFIHYMRQYKAYITYFENNVMYYSGDCFDYYPINIYYGILESFADATLHPMVEGMLNSFEDSENVEEDEWLENISPWGMLNTFIDYGYAYIPIPKYIAENNPPDLEDEGILLNNIDDLYNFWTEGIHPKNPIYKFWCFSSEDKKKIAQEHLKNIYSIYQKDHFAF